MTVNMCSCCGTQYSVLYIHILEFIDSWGGGEVGERMARAQYEKVLLSKMPTPCEMCPQEYKADHDYLLAEYKTWEKMYNKRERWEREHKYSNDWYYDGYSY